MDPISIVTNLIGLAQYLNEVAEQVQQNREECEAFTQHAQAVLELIQSECERGNIPRNLVQRLEKLERFV